jgi:Fe-S cluster assembly iron-binding protein IscA
VNAGSGRLVTDPVSADMLRGAVVDYEDELIRSGFAVKSEPLARSLHVRACM